MGQGAVGMDLHLGDGYEADACPVSALDAVGRQELALLIGEIAGQLLSELGQLLRVAVEGKRPRWSSRWSRWSWREEGVCGGSQDHHPMTRHPRPTPAPSSPPHRPGTHGHTP